MLKKKRHTTPFTVSCLSKRTPAVSNGSQALIEVSMKISENQQKIIWLVIVRMKGLVVQLFV